MTAVNETHRLSDVPFSATQGAPARIVVEYWTVSMDDETSCGSCDQTLTDLEGAIDTFRPVAARLGIEFEIQPRVVATWPQAIDHAIVASPTIRAAGAELHPIHHPDESDARRWTWRGTTSAQAPPEALLDLLVRAVAARSEQLGDYLKRGGPAPYVRQFLQPVGGLLIDAQATRSSAGGCSSSCT